MARAMTAHGHKTALLLRELHAIKATDIAGMQVLQAPVWLPQVNGLPDPPLNFAEILLRFGYHDANCLQGLVTGWRSALELLKADAVVASHSPTALLAARTLDMPAVTLGSGFYVPPRVKPVPNMRPWMPVPPQRLIESDRMVTDSINTVLDHYGKPPLGSLAELFDVAANVFCTFPELDHYHPRIPEMQHGRYCGGMFEKNRGEAIHWPEATGKKILVYLRPDIRDFEIVMQALAALDCQVLAIVPGISTNLKAKLETPKCRILTSGLQLADVTVACDLAISYAGHGFVSAMLMAGVPLLLLPTHLEQFLLSRRICEIGAGVLINPESAAPDYKKLLADMLANAAFKQAATSFAAKYATFDQQDQQEMIVKLIEQVANHE